MKLLFDESLSPRLVPLLRDLFPESESFKTGLPVPAIAGFWTTLPLTTSSWSRQIAISNVC